MALAKEQIRRIVMAGGTFACALGIGFIMQNSDATAARTPDAVSNAQAKSAPNVSASGMTPLSASAPAGSAPQEPAAITSAAVAGGPTALPQDVSGPAPEALAIPAPIAPAEELQVLPAALTAEPPAPEATLPGATGDVLANDACAAVMMAEAQPAAIVRLDLSAPCQPNERVTIHHNGMMFTVITDTDGQAVIDVPALAEEAVFIAAFTNGDGAMVTEQVPSLKFYERVALQWRDSDGFELHAREFGADYGQDGHVWSDNPRDESFVADGTGGYMLRLGDTGAPEALLAEVYTFPAATGEQDGDILLTVEAEVTAANCGREVNAQSLQVKDGEIIVQELLMYMPDCAAQGDFLVLKNMLEDLTIARK